MKKKNKPWWKLLKDDVDDDDVDIAEFWDLLCAELDILQDAKKQKTIKAFVALVIEKRMQELDKIIKHFYEEEK